MKAKPKKVSILEYNRWMDSPAQRVHCLEEMVKSYDGAVGSLMKVIDHVDKRLRKLEEQDLSRKS